MPPMTTMAEGMVTARPRNTNFSIAAIMNENKQKEEDIEEEEEEEELEVGTEVDNLDELSETAEETEKVVTAVKKERKSKITGKSNCPDLDHVKCILDNKDLWDKFCEFGTEMIITRSGRRMFPTVRCSFANIDLEPGSKYLVLLDIVPCDNKRYRYAYHRSSWLVAGKADPAPPHRLYCHPDAPFTAEQLRKQVISFEKVKVTNNESDNTGQVNNPLSQIPYTSQMSRAIVGVVPLFKIDFISTEKVGNKKTGAGSQLSLRFYVRNLLELKGFSSSAIVVLISL